MYAGKEESTRAERRRERRGGIFLFSVRFL